MGARPTRTVPFLATVGLAQLLSLQSAEAYWSSNHREANKNIGANAKLFESTQWSNVGTLDDYLKRVLYVSDGTKAKLDRIPFVEGDPCPVCIDAWRCP
jgi:hypothetical protein